MGKSVNAGAQDITDTSRETQEYYELRIYRNTDAAGQLWLGRYLEKALIPALGRMGIDRIGVFIELDESDDYSIYLLIPYPSLELFAAANPALLSDKEYQKASKDHFAAPKEDPAFTRIQSGFFKAFEGMPLIEMPGQTAGGKPRIFELRIYESHTEEKAALKVDMFNSGETQAMRETGLAPVFFGEALIGDNLPNLTYMLSAAGREEHKAHWAQFSAHPEWKRLQEMPKYDDTVSNITSIFLKPTAYSQI